MASTDGTIIGLTKIVNAGTASGKWNLVIVAEGYRAGELRHFDTHARAFAAALRATPPFAALAAAINVYKLDVSSTDSGADDPPACGGTGAVANTFFDASFCNEGLHRFLLVDNKAVLSAVDAALPEYDAVVVMVNSPLFGGSGEGQVAVCSREARANDIALHELGHSAFDLADEYSEGKRNHRPIEPAQVNVTIQKTLANLKWKQLVAAGTAIPTETNPACRDQRRDRDGGRGRRDLRRRAALQLPRLSARVRLQDAHLAPWLLRGVPGAHHKTADAVPGDHLTIIAARW